MDNELEKANNRIKELEGQIELLKTLKHEVVLADQVIISKEAYLDFEERFIEALDKVKHYESRATSGANLRFAVNELLTYGIWVTDGPLTEEGKTYLEGINKHLTGVIRTRNYIIRKQRVEPNIYTLAEGQYTGEGVEGQGLIVTKVATKETFFI